ncbi:MAG: ABC transporter permease subunit [Cyanobacteria bacterium P01_A01_bin.3]
MGSVVAILRKELRSYFGSPTAYIVAAAFWLLAGFFMVGSLIDVILGSEQADLFAQQFGQGQDFDAGTIFVQQFLGVLGILFLFVLPMLTMGLYAEEQRYGTMELLATSPLTNWSVAVGKWLASLLWFFTILLPLMVCEILALSSTDPGMNYFVWAVAHLGLLLLAGVILALGLFVSSLTDNTLVAAIGTFGLVLFLWVINAGTEANAGAISRALGHLSLLRHYQEWLQGIVSTSSVALFGSLIVFGLFLTVQSVETMRWRQR